MKTHLSFICIAALVAEVGGAAHLAAADSAGARPGKLVVTEVTWRPALTPSTQWVELYNGTSHPIDLGTYVIDTNHGGGNFSQAPNLQGTLAPGQFAIVYNYYHLKIMGLCKAEAECAEYFQKGWPMAKDALMIPYKGNPFPTVNPSGGMHTTDRVLSLWASLDDYKVDCKAQVGDGPNRDDGRAKPQKAVFSVGFNPSELQKAHDLAPHQGTGNAFDPEPTLYLANLSGDPGDPANWKFSVDKENRASRSTAEWSLRTRKSMSDDLMNKIKTAQGQDVGSPGQF